MFSQVRRSTSAQPFMHGSAGTPSCRQRGTSRSGAEQPARLERSIWRTSNGTTSSCDLGWNFERESRRARNQKMHEVHLSNLVFGAGGVSVKAGMIQLFCQALEVRPAKRGRIRAELSLKNWSFRSISPGFMMIGLGTLLLGGGTLFDAP